MKMEIKKKLWMDEMPSPIYINVEHGTVSGCVVIKVEDWNKVLEFMRQNTEVHEFSSEEGNC